MNKTKDFFYRTISIFLVFAFILSCVGCQKPLRFYYSSSTTREQLEKNLGPADDEYNLSEVTCCLYYKSVKIDNMEVDAWFDFSKDENSHLTGARFLLDSSHLDRWAKEFTSHFGNAGTNNNGQEYRWGKDKVEAKISKTEISKSMGLINIIVQYWD